MPQEDNAVKRTYAKINDAWVPLLGADADAILANHGSGTPWDSDPLMDGAASAGVSSLYARGDHVHPSDTTIPRSASIDDNGLISFKSSTNVTLFTLQLPFYDGTIGGIDTIASSAPLNFSGVTVTNVIAPITEEVEGE